MGKQPLNASDRVARQWLLAWGLVAGLLVLMTFLLRTWPDALGALLRPLDLGDESNIAAWFSAASLIWSGLLMWTSAGLLFTRDRWAAIAVCFLGASALALSVDEAGSLHERFDLLFPSGIDFSLKKLAIVLAIPVLLYIGVIFTRRKQLGPQWVLLLAAYGLFGSVYGQELLEHAVDWPVWIMPLRTAIEEGTELIGFFLLLLVGVRLLRSCRSAQENPPARSPYEWVLPGRGSLLIAFSVAAIVGPILILWSVSIPILELQLHHRGDFGSTMTLAMFLIAGVLCLGKALGDPDMFAWRWVALFCLVFSLLQNWLVYADLSVILLGSEPKRLWRTCFDLVWALPIFIALVFVIRRKIGINLWMLGVLVLLWIACLVAMTRGTFRLSYAASYLTALVLGVWIIHATRRRHASP